MNAIEALGDFAGKFVETLVTIKFAPTPNENGINKTYYVLEILYPGQMGEWKIIKAGSSDIDIATKDLFDAWNEIQTKENKNAA